ncbi:FAD-dependent monooxygenase [Streptomyces sp. CA-132043]|uniref:FAD-dependent monooxygenase n=1 Tax=Streptomyces sp. CA-132043 TaxID=3240048 RepID=UPI003D945FCE
MESEVIVVGAGPAGLMLAAELRLAGARVTVLERLEGPSGESRGMGFTARTMEVFDQRGLLPRLGEVGKAHAGHFGSVPIDMGVGDGSHAGVSGVPQSRTEAMLAGWAAELGADVRHGHEVVGLAADDEGVEVEVRGPDGAHRLRAAYLAGCDGGRSTVRQLAGFDFPGTDSTAEMLLADVRDLDLGRHHAGGRLPGGVILVAPLENGAHRIVVSEHGRRPRPRTGPPRFDEVVEGWRRLTGEDISGVTPLWVSAFGDGARQAAEYRRGRVLLAGDAAHIHLPAGGQGMNVSIQDSVNLGWKLGAVARGRAPETLLDTYHGERHPVGAQLLTNTRAQGVLFLGGEEMQPLRDVLARVFRFEDAGRFLAGMVSGLDIRYDVGPDGHPLLGRRMPHQELLLPEGRTSSTALLHRARGVLLDFTAGGRLRGVARGWADRVDHVAAEPHGMSADSPLQGTDAVLVRPDGYVAWTAPCSGSATDALTRWFGPASGG